MDKDLIVKGNLILTDDILYNSYLTIKEGKVSAISSIKPTSEELEVSKFIDATDKIIFPGVIDAHVHCYSSIEEGFGNATRSAAAGGVTTIIEMPYDADKLICTSELFEAKKNLIENETYVDVAMLATIAPKNGLDQVPLLAEAGACGFKVSLFNTHPVRFPKIEEGELFNAFHKIRDTGRPVGVHAETDSIVTKFIEKNIANGNDPLSHCKSRPKVAESTAVLTVLELAHYSRVKLHLYHCTFPRVFELVEYYKENNLDVTAETCTHYLTLSEEDMKVLKAKGKINPPLRTEKDKEGLWNQLSQGKIDMVTSDHAPWLLEQKQNDNIFDNSSGAPGVEVLFHLLYSEGVHKNRITIQQLAKLLSENPAKRFGLGHRKGKIQVGYDADFIIIDPNITWEIDESKMHTSSEWSPYNSKEVNGKILNTFVRGQEVYNGEITVNKGVGEFVHAKFD